MLDHATLSASQGSLAHSSSKNRSRDTDKTPIVVSDLSASVDNLHKNSLNMQHTTQDRLEIASSIAMAKMSEARYPWQEKGATRFFLFVGQLRLLEQRYTLRERDEVLQLLEKYPHLSLLLLEIHRQIVPYFPIAQIFLQAITDPEANDEFETSDENENLVISVVTHMQPREAVDRLKQFYKDWWLKTPNMAKIKEKISFNLECV
jgi:hypothetical protein